MDNLTEPVLASDIATQAPPRCLSCGQPMPYYGGTAGYVCCEMKILFKGGGWFDASGEHLDDRRLNNQLTRGIRQH